MTTVRVDAATLEHIRAAGGNFLMSDEAGTAVHVAQMDEQPFEFPPMTDEEWAARIAEPGGMTTDELLAHLQTLDRP